MIVPSLYRLYPISHTLYRILYIVYPTNLKTFKFSKKNPNFHKFSKLKKKIENFQFLIHVLSKAWLKYMI